MIVSVCADKGAPGATVLATVLGLVWPGERLVLEADPSGGDLSLRLPHAAGDRLLDPQPSVLTLAADSRGAALAGGAGRYVQLSALGVPVVVGPPSAESWAPVGRLWPQVTGAVSRWEQTVVADLGRLQPGGAQLPIAAASTAVLVVVRPDLPGLYHLRERVRQLAGALGDPALQRSPVAVVVRAPAGSAGSGAVRQVRQVLEAAGSAVQVAGLLADDPDGVALLHAGAPNRRLLGSELVRSAQTLVGQVVEWWPQLQTAGPGQLPAGGAATPQVRVGLAGRLGLVPRRAARAAAVPAVEGADGVGVSA